MLPSHFPFVLGPAPPTDLAIGDSGVTTSSIELKWSSGDADEYEFFLDGAKIASGVTGTTYTVTHTDMAKNSAVTAGTTYTCTLVGKTRANFGCSDATAEPQSIACTTAQTLPTPICTSKLHFLNEVLI